jgi:hypothetical protein
LQRALNVLRNLVASTTSRSRVRIAVGESVLRCLGN